MYVLSCVVLHTYTIIIFRLHLCWVSADVMISTNVLTFNVRSDPTHCLQAKKPSIDKSKPKVFAELREAHSHLIPPVMFVTSFAYRCFFMIYINIKIVYR